MRIVLLAILLMPVLTGAAGPRAAQPAADPIDLPELALQLRPPDGLQRQPRAEPPLAARLTGAIAGCPVVVELWAFDARKARLNEPDAVVEYVQDARRDDERPGRAALEFGAREVLTGKLGAASYALLTRADLRQQEASSSSVSGRLYLLAGLLEQHAYALTVECSTLPDAAAQAAIESFLKSGLVYTGKVRDPKWTDAEARERWKRDVPADVADELEGLLRTEHYLILTNSSGGKAFAKKMEECYAAIQKTYPFPEIKGRRLLPVFLFQTAEQYWAYYAQIASIPLEQAKKSKGHAWRDYYATWYESPNDTVHVHEATHQLFSNRLYLAGGGSWLQEGVAEYMSTKANERNDVARLVKKGRHTHLPEFVAIQSLLYSAKDSAKGDDEAGDHYKQAALLIEFLREGKWKQDKFPDFLRAAGNARRNDKAAIEAAARAVYGVSLEELDAAFVEWAKKR